MQRRGFTLIELLVVIVIIGILIGIVLPAIIDLIGGGRNGAAMATIRTLEESLSSYKQFYYAYPPDDVDLGLNNGQPVMGSIQTQDKYGTESLVNSTNGYLLKIRTGGLPFYSPGYNLDASGNMTTPVDPTYIFKYRENFSKMTKAASMHNPYKFDIWCPNTNRAPDGNHNW